MNVWVICSNPINVKWTWDFIYIEADEQQYMNSLETSRVVPRSKKMLNFGGREQNCSSSGTTPCDVRKNITVDADVDAMVKDNSLSKKRCPDEDVCVATDDHKLRLYFFMFLVLILNIINHIKVS